jgi:phospholipid/cholesterol/gamma-HCH transport system substrate-binding protein
MTGRGLEIRVGFVVVVAALAAVIGTMWFQKFQLAEKRYSFFAVFNEVGGLVSGDPIYVNGVERGRVNRIDLGADRVVVEMAVREGVVIPSDSRVALKSIGIMGERLVAITLGDSPAAIAAGDTLTGEFLMGLSEVMGAAGSILDDVKATTAQLREIAETLGAEGKLREGVEDFAATSRNMRGITENNRARLDRAIMRFDRSAMLLDSLLTGHYTELDSSFAALARAGGKFDVTVNNLHEVSNDLKDITAKLKSGEGTAGRLLNDDTLIRRLERTSASLDTLLKDIREHPGRYVTFSLF